MSLVIRRSNRTLLFATVAAFILFLHVLYSAPSLPQLETPSLPSSGTLKHEDVADRWPEGVPLRIYSEPGSAPSTAPELESEPYPRSRSTSLSSATPKKASTSASIEATALSSSIASPVPKPENSLSQAFRPTYSNAAAPQNNTHLADSKSLGDLPCNALPGGEDVLVVMRTGATELRDKLPMHLSTTFRCFPNFIIFSDYEESFEGHQVHDAFKYMNDKIKNSHPDFELYRHIQQVGRAGLDDSELSGNLSFNEHGQRGKLENAGWKLDKWKFMPMANMTYSLHPDKKWFVFVEADTYLVWSNLLQWLTKLDPSEKIYAGSEAGIGTDVFAHGGSGFLASRPALGSGVHIYRSRTQELHNYTNWHWAGDCILGKAMHVAGVPLMWTWPMMQGGNPYLMDYQEDKEANGNRLWCSPALSYHHFSPLEIQDMFHFEQDWIKSKTLRINPTFSPDLQQPLIHHSDLFTSWIMQNMTSERADWNNTSRVPMPQTAGHTAGDCRVLCESKKRCAQYAVGPEGCYLERQPIFGRGGNGVSSGWIPSRVKQWVDTMNQCDGLGGWTQPDEEA